MYYTAQQGVQTTWSSSARDTLRQTFRRNWLPFAVSVLVTAWLGLVIAGLSQTDPALPSPPAHASSSAGSLEVGTRTDTPSNLAVVPSSASTGNTSSGSSMKVASASGSSSSTSNTSAVPAASSSSMDDVLGGRGADDSGTSAPVVPVVPDITDDSSASDETEPAVGVDLDVDPILDVSLGLGGDSLVQLDVGGLSVGL